MRIRIHSFGLKKILNENLIVFYYLHSFIYCIKICPTKMGRLKKWGSRGWDPNHGPPILSVRALADSIQCNADLH